MQKGLYYTAMLAVVAKSNMVQRKAKVAVESLSTSNS